METSTTTGAIAEALAKAHLEIDNPELDGVNPHFKSRFSTLAAVLNAVRKPLAKQGIALMQSVSFLEGRIGVTTSLHHASGEWMRETMAFPIPGNSNVQQAGSTVTYLRRYSLISLCAIVGDPDADDDGDGDRKERAQQRPAARQKYQAPKAAVKTAPKPEPKMEQVDGEWVRIVCKWVDEGVAGKNSTPYVKIKDPDGNTYFAWDLALHPTLLNMKGETIWAITEASKKEGAPPRIVEIRTAAPVDSGDMYEQ